MLLSAPGSPISPDALAIPKAVSLAKFLQAGKHAYCTLIEVRSDTETFIETIVFDVYLELNQDRVNPIRDRERVAASFYPSDEFMPEVVALRADFPWVPHLNQRDSEFPRSLCLYEQPYSRIKLRWTPTSFERIREWLSLSAEGTLHQEDQPLEHVFLGRFPPLIVPSNFLKKVKDQSNPGNALPRFNVYATGVGPEQITGFWLSHDPSLAIAPGNGPSYVASVVAAPPQKHGVVRNTPGTLGDVIEVMSHTGIDLVGLLRESLRAWKDDDPNVVRARLLLILAFPKLRDADSSPETWEWDTWGFLLGSDLAEIGAKLGMWQPMNGTLAALLPYADHRGQELPVQIVSPVAQLSRESAARFNGTTPNERRCVMVGVGAIGSLTLVNLIKKGFGVWTIIDDDIMMPHNVARHALPGTAAGLPKVAAVKAMADSLYEGSPVSSFAVANLFHPGSQREPLASILHDADLIFDCTADVAAARYLTIDAASDARRLSLFLSPSGEQLVLLLEDTNRSVRLDALEMQFYRMLLDRPALQDHYASSGELIRYGRSCRDLSSVLSGDAIALFAALGSRAIERLVLDDGPAIRVWKNGADLSVRSFEQTPRKSFRVELEGYAVEWDEGTIEKAKWLRGERLPNETGGVIFGCWDLSRKCVYIVDVTGAPTDSNESPRAFIRGSNQVKEWRATVARTTGEAVEYIGEWHSHPRGYSTCPSNDDRKVFRWIEDHLSIDGLPAVMLIIGDSEMTWMSTADGPGDLWKYPRSS